MPKVLLISLNEICYNARLLKAGDSFYESGWEVTVFNSVVGIASEDVYSTTLNRRKWKVIENDISKRTTYSKIKWLIVSVLHKTIKIFHRIGIKIFSQYYMNKGLIFRPPIGKNYDVIIINLINNLPFAVHLKNKCDAKLIYDSQEYFVGQYAAFNPFDCQWVKENEKRYIQDIDVLLATTNVMRKKIIEDYSLNIPTFRVRNVPTKKQTTTIENRNDSSDCLKLVWHGMAIYFNNRRGVHILIKAIAACRENVKLYLQGNLPKDQAKILEQYQIELNLKGKIEIIPAANPDEIIHSLLKYDVGLTAELPEELNQELTSSNKLFDYIHSGLAVISSDVLGLAETIDEYKVGIKYQPGNIQELSQRIDELAKDRELLRSYQLNSVNASNKLYWDDDYLKVLDKINTL